MALHLPTEYIPTPEHDIRSHSQAGPHPAFPAASPTFLHTPGVWGMKEAAGEEGKEDAQEPVVAKALQTSHIS